MERAMGRLWIVILDGHPGQEIGKTVRVFLQRENRYKLDLTDQLPRNPADLCQSGPDLIISVLPAGAERAGRVLEMLRGPKADVPLLPVISPDTLSEMLDGQNLWAKDFLVPPLRGAEVCARVRQWFLSRSGRQ